VTLADRDLLLPKTGEAVAGALVEEPFKVTL